VAPYLAMHDGAFCGLKYERERGYFLGAMYSAPSRFPRCCAGAPVVVLTSWRLTWYCWRLLWRTCPWFPA
jgi:hypothetical protein